MRTVQQLIAIVVILSSLSLMGCGKVTIVNSNNQDTPIVAANNLNIGQQITGQSMALKLPNVFLINSEKQINATRSRQLKDLKIDFNTQSIVLIALGEQKSGGYWIKITGIQTADNGDAYVQAIANKPTKSQATTSALTYPYAAIVTGKITGNVIPEIESVTGQDIP